MQRRLHRGHGRRGDDRGFLHTVPEHVDQYDGRALRNREPHERREARLHCYAHVGRGARVTELGHVFVRRSRVSSRPSSYVIERGAMRDVERHVLLAQTTRAARTRIVPAVTRIQHHAPHLARAARHFLVVLRRILGHIDYQPKRLRHVKYVPIRDRIQIQDDPRARGLRAGCVGG